MPIKDEHGAVVGMVLKLVDTSERERKSLSINNAHIDAQLLLEQRVRERTKELEVARQEMEAFSYAVSHDLRAPLRAINGFIGALYEDCNDLLGEQGRMYIERIQDATNRMGGIIDGLLRLSLISRSQLRRERVDLSEIAHEELQHLHEESPRRAVDIHITSGLVVVGDAALLRVLIQNLVANAWKFTSCCSSACIRFTREQLCGHEVFAIRDNGVGFEMEDATKLFQPFMRLHGRDEFEGAGIGLATVKRIIERHGGMVAAQGEPQHGATIYFTLPTFDGASQD